MLFVISLTLSLLVLAASLFLIAKSKQDLGTFFKIMAWIIFAFGILAIVMSIHMAIFKCMMHKHEKSEMMEHQMFCHNKGDMDKCERYENMCGDRDFDKEEGMEIFSKIMKCCDNDKCCNPDMESKAIVKIVSDNVKLTPDQEKNITAAIVQSLKACCSGEKDKPCCDKDNKDKEKECKDKK
ncbi:MAG: hypothetical protein ABR968_13950 [Bacteroidales bacterium]|jgi:predicted membrane protein